MAAVESASTPELAGLPELAGFSHRFVQAGDLRMHVAEGGNPEGPPVLLVHGWPAHWWMWRRVAPRLADRFRLIAPDLRGFGWTDAPSRSYGKEEMATDLVHLLDALELDRPHVLAHDWGGYVAFLLAILHPERVERYVALNIIHPWLGAGRLREWPGTIRRFDYQIPIITPGLNTWAIGRGGYVPWLLRRGAVHGDVWTESDFEVYRERFRDRARIRASARLYRRFIFREMTPLIAGRYRDRRLHAPTLLLFGEQDHSMSPGQLRGFEPYADDMRVEFVPDSGHNIAEEKPDLVAQRARDHFAASSAQPGAPPSATAGISALPGSS